MVARGPNDVSMLDPRELTLSVAFFTRVNKGSNHFGAKIMCGMEILKVQIALFHFISYLHF
jgi:hypothetical protein